ncbi:putative transposase [Silvimonas terrae]|uniref:Putative transposase n=1 Tax=Silvimonas terrae TaxID=300266 RepID=A0A840RJ95_9NEIS|nr:Mu transposase C-terminal domain-containing protein [Silvimonas terrae]MBB5192293.1 putative transposase [Silvimonas terrae]
MQRFSFKRGLVFIEGQQRWEMHRRRVTGMIQLLSDSGEVLNLSVKEILRRWHSQTWLIDEASLGELGNAIYIATPRDLSTFPEQHQQIAKRRLYYLTAIDAERTPYNQNIWAEKIKAAAKEAGDSRPPCASTVSSWWRRYRSTKSILKLIPHNSASSAHFEKPAYRVFEEVIAAIYLTDQKLPKIAVAEAMYRQINALNNGLPDHERLKKPGRSTIYRWLEALQQDLIDTAREGAEAARMKYRAALGSVQVSGILERIEIDHSPLDINACDDANKLPLGRPWLSLAIDRLSRMILGFYLSFNAPSSHGVLQCLRRAILPKDELLARFPDIKNTWPACGIPSLIAIDNGTDLHSKALEMACLEMGIQILFCGSRTPQHKGAVERFFRTMNMGLIHRLPGTVFSNPDQRGDYPSEKNAALDLNTLVHLITKWIVDVYNVTPHRGLNGRSPLDVWTECANRQVIELPVHPQQLEVIAGIPASRTLFHYGIELEGLHYNSELLQIIRRRAGKNCKVNLKYYEDDVSHIHVFDPDTNEYLKVAAKQAEYAKGLTRDLHRMVREHVRKTHGDSSLAPHLLQARHEIEELVRGALKSKKTGTRKSGASTVQHDSEAVWRNEDPLAKARNPIRNVKEQPPGDLPSGLDDTLPDFGPSPTNGED